MELALGPTCPEGEGGQGALQVGLVEVGPGRQVAPRVCDGLQHALLPHQLHKLLCEQYAPGVTITPGAARQSAVA